ncbi:MAG: hypothetical protein HKN30_12310 [Sulfitobacter sp.]|nr:hypothetical protein [Sulfitobacter sp.]
MKSISIILMTMLLPAAAIADTYRCETKNFGRGGWVPSEMILSYDEAKGEATAFDPMIKHLHENPILVDMKRRSDTSF